MHLLTAVLLPAAVVAQPAAAPDEIRVSSRPYVPASPYTIRVETKLVELSVQVHDGNGHAVHGLTRDNFRIIDEGKEREIAAFSEESTGSVAAPGGSAPGALATTAPPAAIAPPRFLALFIDDVNAKDYASALDLPRTKTAARKFIAESFSPGVRIGIFTASGTVTQDFTTDAAKCEEAIDNIKSHPRMSERGLQYCPRITPYRSYLIDQLRDRATILRVVAESAPPPYGFGCMATADQVRVEAQETWRQVREISMDTLASIDWVVNHLAKMPGSRVLLLASSGFFGETLEQRQHEVIDHAIHAGVVINALDSKGLYVEGCEQSPRPSECVAPTVHIAQLATVNAAMADLAHGTGGEFFHNNNDLHAGLRQLGAVDVVYHMSFRPEGVKPDGSFHKLKVKLAHAGNYDVAARPGYFAPSDQPTDDPRSKLERAVTASDTVDEFPAGLAVQIQRPSPTQRTLSIVVRIDVSKLPFASAGDRKRELIAFISAILDSQGKIVAAKEGTMALALTQETYDRLVKTGLNAELSFQMPPGVYALREVVEDAAGGKLSAATHSIDLR